MDPFSLTVGAIALAETATKLASFITDRYRAYDSAPKEMLEIASQVTMCAGLVDVFARSIENNGEPFPRHFQKDASALIVQCRKILVDIEDTIPRGSNRPDYADKLKYAFSSQKKILKHQENLKQVQHMFMFMTTCWQFQLPSQQSKAPPISSNSAMAMPMPIGNLQGTLQHMPIQINMQSPSNATQMVTYEATLTLKPMEHHTRQEEARKEQEMRQRKSAAISRGSEALSREKQMLANMRRSPYFSLDLLKPKVEVEIGSHYRMGGREKEKIDVIRYGKDELVKKEKEERVKLETEMRRRKEYVDVRVMPPSSEEASRDVDDMLTQWFQEDSEPSKDTPDYDSKYASEAPTIINAAPLPKGGLGVEVISRPSTSTSPKLLEWDWRCDACKKEYFYHDTRFNCRDCYNFDLCPDCFGEAWHRHDKLSFVERNR